MAIGTKKDKKRIIQRGTASARKKKLYAGRNQCPGYENSHSIIGGRLVVSEQCHPYSLQAYNMEYIVFRVTQNFNFNFILLAQVSEELAPKRFVFFFSLGLSAKHLCLLRSLHKKKTTRNATLVFK